MACSKREPRDLRSPMRCSAWILTLLVLPGGPILGQSSPTAAQRPSIDAYAPQLKQLEQKGDWAGVETLARQALDALQARLGPESPDVAAAAVWLTSALQAQGRLGEAEPIIRQALAIDEKVLGPDHPATGTCLYFLGLVLQSQGHYQQAEPITRRALSIREKVLGPDHPVTGLALTNLATLLQLLGRYEEAEPLARRALAIDERSLPPDHPDTAIAALRLSRILLLMGRFNDAEPLARRALAIDEKTLGPAHRSTADAADNLASVVEARGRADEAEALFRRALSIREQTLGPEHTDTASSMNNLAGLLQGLGRYGEAEPLLRRALAVDSKVLGAEHAQVATDSNNLAVLLRYEHHEAEAEQLFRRTLAILEKTVGPDHPDVAFTLGNLGTLLTNEGRYADAEPLLRRALVIAEKSVGPDAADTAGVINNLAALLAAERRYADAQPLMLRAMVIAEKTLGPDHPNTATALQHVADNAIAMAHFGDAVGAFRLACAARSTINRSRGRSAEAAQAARAQATNCATRLSLSLFLYARQGGGEAPRNRPEAIKLEAFSVSQQALQSAAGDALARSAAFTAATSASVGPQARAYEAALLERDDLDRRYARAVGGSGGRAQLQALSTARADAAAKIEQLAASLKSQAPRYWDYRSPEPVSVTSLQSTTGPDARLLRKDEALILFLAVTGDAPGLVFAVSKEKVAWAALGLSSNDIKSRITHLRARIDPDAYGVPAGAAGAGAAAGSFDRRTAYELYAALLGDAGIQSVIADKPVWLFVPSGALTSLPPGLLVTAPPTGGAEDDRNPEVLRATPWLLRAKAVALLPAVSSLRTLRQILSGAQVNTPDPLLAFADPEFRRPNAPPKKRTAWAAARGYSTFYRDGLPLADALDGLPSLPGTRLEGEALERALGGRPGSLLTGREASKAQLMARNADGRLAQVRVLEFATHGLVAGDASDLAEPALALAAGATPADELLLASEASTLQLHADWVLLSACNTASPDAPEAQGLSGLSRAFFFAGARSLLVSHWPVRDDVAPQLIPAMLHAERLHPDLGHAQALRQATLAILDDRSIDAANPSAWAPFTLIGEPAQ